MQESQGSTKNETAQPNPYAETLGTRLWATRERWIASVDVRPTIHAHTIKYLQTIQLECHFVGLLGHEWGLVGIIKVDLKNRYRHVWF